MTSVCGAVSGSDGVSGVDCSGVVSPDPLSEGGSLVSGASGASEVAGSLTVSELDDSGSLGSETVLLDCSEEVLLGSSEDVELDDSEDELLGGLDELELDDWAEVLLDDPEEVELDDPDAEYEL